MNLHDVVTFINSAYVMTQTRDAHAGGESGPLAALRAKAKGSKLAVARKVTDNPYGVAIAHVKEILPGAYALSIENEEHDSSTLVLMFRKATSSERAGWTNAWDGIEDLEGEVDRALDEMLQAEFTPTDPSTLKPFQFTPVSTLVRDGEKPSGVLVQGAKSVVAAGFDESGRSSLGRFANMSRLEDAEERAGRQTMLGRTRPIRGANVNDAAQRALYEVAKNYYTQTGKSVYT